MNRLVRILFVVVTALAAACGPGADMSPESSNPQTLAGTSWRAITVAGAAPVVGREPTLTFTDDGINGNTGCNGFFGGYTYADGTIAFSQMGMTLMACDDAIGGVEMAYTQALNGAATAAIDDDGRLVLGGSGGEIVFAPTTDS
jgi:heat shock protein HslJ